MESNLKWFSDIQKCGIPESILLHFWVDVVWSGIEGKYPNIDKKYVYALANDWIRNKSINNEDESICDIFNQLTALNKIEYEWQRRKFDIFFR